MSGPHGVVHEAGVPLRPSTSTRQSRQDPKGSSESVAQSLGISMPSSAAARMIDVPAGTVTSVPSISTVTGLTCAEPGGRAGVPRSGSLSRVIAGPQPVVLIGLLNGLIRLLIHPWTPGSAGARFARASG